MSTRGALFYDDLSLERSSKVENFKKSKKNHSYVFFKTENRVRKLTTSSTTHGVGKKLSLYEIFQKSCVFSQESTPPNMQKSKNDQFPPLATAGDLLATTWRTPGDLATWRPLATNGTQWFPVHEHGAASFDTDPTGDHWRPLPTWRPGDLLVTYWRLATNWRPTGDLLATFTGNLATHRVHGISVCANVSRGGLNLWRAKQ